MKVMFVGNGIFSILSVKGFDMARLPTSEPPVQLLLPQLPISELFNSRKPSSHPNQALHVNDDKLIKVKGHPFSPVMVATQAAKECHPPASQVSPRREQEILTIMG
ncbi:hypothetical protein PIB30_046251, partial [Stylosanthes scabra]|nr:hypothetical protein [Stylosanthes scabra]